jgi:hypothetical protein
LQDYLETGIPLPGGGDCTNCHEFTGTTQANRIAGHHTYTTIASAKATGGSAMSGECITCHKPDVGQETSTRTVASPGNISMPRNLACNYCHLWWPNEAYTGSPINIYQLDWDPNGDPNADAGDEALTTHAISTNTTEPISDYAACFACHGAYRFTGSSTESTAVAPFHGYGIDGDEVYTGDSFCTGSGGCGGQADDMINIYGSPNVTGFDTGSNHLSNKGHHPGFNSLNSLEPYLGLEDGSSNPGKGDFPYGGHSSAKKAHQADAGQYESANITVGTDFDIPWDSFTSGKPSAPQTVSIEAEADLVNKNDSGETHTVDTTVRTVPLDGTGF